MTVCNSTEFSQELAVCEAGLNQNIMLGIFRDNLLPVTHDGGLSIQSCKLSRYRYSPGNRAIFQYLVYISDSEQDQQYTTWVTVFYHAKKKSRRRVIKVNQQAGNSRNGKTNSDITRFASDEKLNVNFQVYPYDLRLLSLQQFIADPSSEFIQALRPKSISTNSVLVEHECIPQRYRPFQSATVKVLSLWKQTEKSSGMKSIAYVKFFRNRSQYCQSLNASRIFAGASLSGIRFSQVVAKLPEPKALVYEPGIGVPMNDCIANNSLEAIKTAGKNLVEFHGLPGSALNVREPAEFYERFQKAKTIIVQSLPAVASLCEELTGELVRHYPGFVPSATHMDMKPEHLLVDFDTVTVIDLDSARQGDCLYDIAMMLARIQAMQHESDLSVETIRQAQQAFMNGYFVSTSDCQIRRLNYWFAAAALKIALFCVQHRISHWESITTQYLENGLSALKGFNSCWARSISS